MAFDDIEKSEELGQPVRCYRFTRSSVVFAYTSANRNITLNNIEFKSGSQIADPGFENTGGMDASTVEITIHIDSEISRAFQAFPPSNGVNLVIWDGHYGSDDFVVTWMGLVETASWPDSITCKLSCQSLASSMTQPGLRRCWQRGCSNTLYDEDCRVNPEAYRVDDQVASMDGLSVDVALLVGFPDDYFSGGYITFTTQDGFAELRGVRRQTGRHFVLLGGTAGLYTGAAVALYPGCNRVIATCHDKFNNSVNYGGQPHLPGRSPFDGNPIFN
ncbi:tail assembly protein [Pseudomonas phage SM1]|uniref:Bacteriophage phiJL001 Gp84 C-terminal domain-containing protein n=2 Tax=Samunavirus TaxID=2560221 RepID=A0A0U3DZV3_9CAUD|nr:tail assembly protein [Pseudomonas phage SM1]UGC97139.1 hypothetical protein [Pseudomonas phage BHU-1]UGV19902.1 hypothetical protein [Pseudomonas phage Pa BHU-15]UIW13658.1 hypothetical protein [Pseudomonas phage Pa BHU-17]UVN14056.1 hypothetical protein FBPa45_0054 [Pseudomonas phage vB_PaeS_FBPa45]WDS62556.1 hypothetical protein UFRH6_130 [Pseudomonas phage UF_RH6]HBO9768537.1 DUF2163 domain-containing protein [Pseudomonas aeruginosa]